MNLAAEHWPGPNPAAPLPGSLGDAAAPHDADATLGGDRRTGSIRGEFETLFRSSPVAMAYTPDRSCAVVLRNAAMNRIIPPEFDWQAWRAPDGSSPGLFVEGQPLGVDRQLLRRAAARGEPTLRLEVELRWPGQESIWLLVSAEPLRDATGAACGAVCVALDVTLEKHIAHAHAVLVEREQTARREAEAANHAKDQLIAMLGHEMRNPMNAIATAAEVLKRALPGSREAQSAVQIIGRQTRQLANLLDEVGEVGRASAGEIELHRQPLELGALVERCVAKVAGAAATKGQTLKCEVTEVWVDADAQRIAQAIDRLLDNAVRYTPADGGICVRVQAATGSAGAEAAIDVQDDGIGIGPDLLARVFEPFVQGPRSLDRPGGGLGIGLTLVRSLISQHGGHVEARDNGQSSKRGSRFEVRLPAIATPALAPPAARLGEPFRIGVIDDHPDALFSVCALLALGGHAVTTAADGPAGVAMLLRDAPDVAIVDIGLPGFDGYEVARRSRAGGFRGRLIALSGYAQDRDASQSFAAGFEAHLIKPVDATRLARLLQSGAADTTRQTERIA